MILVEKHIINKSHKDFKRIDELCYMSKNLYNQSLYKIKEVYNEEKRFIRYNELEKWSKSLIEFNNYKDCTSAASQQILMILDQNIKSYLALLKVWKKNKNILNGLPKFPKFKAKEGRNIFIVRGDLIRLKNNKLVFPNKLNLNDLNSKIKDLNLIKQVRIIPKSNRYILEVVYEKKELDLKLEGNKCAIDLGINNLMSITFDNNQSVIVNGKNIKSINKYFNKKKAKIQSKLPFYINKKGVKQQRYNSNKIINLTNKRNNKINDNIHKITKNVVELIEKNKVNEVAIGYNKEWKQEVNLGKKTNQVFTSIPYKRIIDILSYKLKLKGIKLITNEESYTSKCSSLDKEDIKYHENYLGKRIKRGIFKTKQGLLINADINGSLNIGRKVFGDDYMKYYNSTNIGLVINPVKLNLY